MFSGLDSPLHWLVLLVVVLLVFGPRKLPEIGRSLGSGLRSFRDAVSGEDAEPPRQVEETRPAPDEPRES
jgi:sec-independent protein translocase protein TatA